LVNGLKRFRMTDVLDVSQDFLPDPKLIDALLSNDRLVQSPVLLARLRKQQVEARSAFEKQSENLNQLYEEIEHGEYDPGYLAQMAEVVREKERAQAERLRPGMEALQQKLAIQGLQLDPEIQEYFQESLDIAVGWLELYRTLRERLLTLASERRGSRSEILRARPLEGDIDHETLTREIVARFPKILAALAK
jgi:hypothetical protein